MNLLDKNLQQYRSRIDEIVKRLHELTIDIGHDELAQTVSDLRNRINEPFMFVIVGEVKAGKSSFVNALLATGREITKVAPQPMTDTIQQILYGEQEEIVEVNPYLKKIFQPIEILREIAIVDTPGTNTIVEHHQEITERFIPAADLIVFVFEAKNPYRQSAWQFLDFIRDEWRKKIVFVLQQKDLMPEADLAINLNGVREFAEKKGIENPLVFAVSAKQEQEDQPEKSGYRPLRDYIQQNITGGKAAVLKLENNIETSRNINERIERGVATRRQQWAADTQFRQDILSTLDEQAIKSNKQVDILVENLLAGYDRITYQKEKELAAELSFFALLRRSIASIFSSSQSAKERLTNLAKDLENELNRELRTKLDSGVVDLAESIQDMAKLIDLKLQSSTNILKNNHYIFSDIAERRANVLRDLQEAFSQFIARSENFTDRELFSDSDSLSPNLATGSGLAVIGIIITAVTQGAVFDITGGVLTTIGLLFAGVSTSVKKRKILNSFSAEIAKGRMQIEEEVTRKLKTYVAHIRNRIDNNFQDFDFHLQREQEQILALEQRQNRISEELTTVKQRLTTALT